MRGRWLDEKKVQASEVGVRVGTARPLRPTWPLALAAGLAAVSVGWFAGALAGWWGTPVVGWLPMPVGSLIAGWLCLRAARVAGLPAPARRFWHCLAATMVLLAAGVLLNIFDALAVADAPSQKMRPATVVVYVAAVLFTLCGLLRMPSGFAGAWLRLILDSGAVVITAALFIWHFSFSRVAEWTAATGSLWPMITIVAVAFVAVVAFMKVVTAGLGTLDRGALRWLAAATSASAVGGSISPLLIAHPVVSNAHVAVPAGWLLVAIGADRQLRAAGLPAAPPRRRRVWNALPYVAVAAANALLLVAGGGPDGRALAVGAVSLTALVVFRQVAAFAENSRLLARVDRGMSELREARDQLAHQANHDELTGLPNRVLMQERVREALAAHGPAEVHLALIDLDDFKAVNDRLGHHVGDALLVAVAERLATMGGPAAGGGTAGAAGGGAAGGGAAGNGAAGNGAAPGSAGAAAGGAAGAAVFAMARLGGDEFAILFAPAGRDEVDAAARAIAEAMQRPFRADGYDLLIHASLGVADATGAQGARELLRRADVAMYAAKDRGKRRFFRYEPELDRDASEDARLGADLRRALDNGELYLLYQPIVRLPHGRVVGAEALIRWNHPERGFVPPDVFIPVAERTGLIVPLGDWILRQACRQAVRWERSRPGAVRKISVNVSARQLREPDFAASVASVLTETGLPVERLAVEITETAVFDGGAALDSVHALHGQGVALALDDFGTGHSSLGLLRTCPVDILKVDKSFVDEITSDDGDQAVIATALIQIAGGLHLQAVAEGVETAEQADRLYQLGYRLAQGYHFARPLPPDQLEALLPVTEEALDVVG